jgi:hypothetical protein
MTPRPALQSAEETLMAPKPKTADEDLAVADPETEAATVEAEVAADLAAAETASEELAPELVVPDCDYVVVDDFTITIDWSTVAFKAGARLDPVAGARLASMNAPVAPVEG